MPIRLRKIFCSYASSDEPLARQLEQHLALLKHERLIDTWTFRNIDAGEDWRQRIHQSLEAADIAVLLVSPAFMASDYCYNIEMKRALELHESHRCTVVPVIVRPCDWRSAPFASLQALPEKARAITEWRNRDRGWTTVVDGLRRVVTAAPLPRTAESLETHAVSHYPAPICTPVEMHATSGGRVVTKGRQPRLAGGNLGPVGLEFEITNVSSIEMSIRDLAVEVVHFEEASLLREIPYAALAKPRTYTCTVDTTIGGRYRCSQLDAPANFVKLAGGELERFSIRVDGCVPGLYRLAVALRYSLGGAVSEILLTAPKAVAVLGGRFPETNVLLPLRTCLLQEQDRALRREAALEVLELHDDWRRHGLSWEIEHMLSQSEVKAAFVASAGELDEWYRRRASDIVDRLR